MPEYAIILTEILHRLGNLLRFGRDKTNPPFTIWKHFNNFVIFGFPIACIP